MKLEELYLTKEELPIYRQSSFYIPIHPTLLDPKTTIGRDLAPKAFAKTVGEWFDDLKAYRETEQLEDEISSWYDDAFLKERPTIEKAHGMQKVSTIGWEDLSDLMDNGFCRVFSISRNSGGTLYYSEDDDMCRAHISFEEGQSKYYLFSKEKAAEFRKKDSLMEKSIIANVYAQHNIDYYPGALFLRNWAINYMNLAFEDVGLGN